MHIDFALPLDGDMRSGLRLYERKASAAVMDYGFHMAVTSWSDDVAEDMEWMVHHGGVASFKFFLAYKGALMVDDTTLLMGLRRCREIGALPLVHGENGDAVEVGQLEMIAKGITGPEVIVEVLSDFPLPSQSRQARSWNCGSDTVAAADRQHKVAAFDQTLTPTILRSHDRTVFLYFPLCVLSRTLCQHAGPLSVTTCCVRRRGNRACNPTGTLRGCPDIRRACDERWCCGGGSEGAQLRTARSWRGSNSGHRLRRVAGAPSRLQNRGAVRDVAANTQARGGRRHAQEHAGVGPAEPRWQRSWCVLVWSTRTLSEPTSPSLFIPVA